MTTAEHPNCEGCPLRSTSEFVSDQLVPHAPVLVLLDRTGDEAPPDVLLAAAKLRRGVNVSVGAALRCRPSPRVPGGKRLGRALAACRVHDDFAGLIVAIGPIGWQALGLTGWTVSRGYVREVAE